jgi:hypothetical protein
LGGRHHDRIANYRFPSTPSFFGLRIVIGGPGSSRDRLAGHGWLAEALEAHIVVFSVAPAPGDFLLKPLPGGR